MNSEGRYIKSLKVPDRRLKGLLVRGGFEIDSEWEGGSSRLLLSSRLLQVS